MERLLTINILPTVESSSKTLSLDKYVCENNYQNFSGKVVQCCRDVFPLPSSNTLQLKIEEFSVPQLFS